MTGIVWLASYPKSGNTWFRVILANLASEHPVDINDMPGRGGIASGRPEFEAVTWLDSGLLTHEEADALRPRLYEALAGGAHPEPEVADPGAPPRPRFIKAHDAYVSTGLGEPLFARIGRAILIVRDPRDVAPSFAHHRHTTIDAAIALMNGPDAALAGGRNALTNQLRQRLNDWSGHAASWLEQRDIPVHLVRYEDLADDPVAVFGAAMAFAGVAAPLDDVRRAVEFASFERLRAQELERGFREWIPGRGRAGTFFRRGQRGSWRDDLSPRQVASIEAAHGPMMRRLGYELSAAGSRSMKSTAEG